MELGRERGMTPRLILTVTRPQGSETWSLQRPTEPALEPPEPQCQLPGEGVMEYVGYVGIVGLEGQDLQVVHLPHISQGVSLTLWL